MRRNSAQSPERHFYVYTCAFAQMRVDVRVTAKYGWCVCEHVGARVYAGAWVRASVSRHPSNVDTRSSPTNTHSTEHMSLNLLLVKKTGLSPSTCTINCSETFHTQANQQHTPKQHTLPSTSKVKDPTQPTQPKTVVPCHVRRTITL